MTKDSFIFDTTHNHEVEAMRGCLDLLVMSGAMVEVKKYKPTRSSLQNRALHLFYRFVAESLNDNGIEFQWLGLRGKVLSCPYTETLVKERIWKQIQMAIFDTDSTTKLTTEQINVILDVIIKFLGEQGIKCNFPSRFDKYLEQMQRHG